MSTSRMLIISWILGQLLLSAIIIVGHVLRRRSVGFDYFSKSVIAGGCSPGRDRHGLLWCLLGLLALATAFGALEKRQAHYFAQDDALVCEMPGMLAGCRSVWSGVWPDYDPYRCMGGPLAGLGLYSLTYPPTFLAYAIARHRLHDEGALLDVFAAIHLVAGYFITYWLCRRLGIRASVAVAATLSFLLSGSVLIMGRSWHAFITIVVWLPLMMALLQQWSERQTKWWWPLAGGGAIAAFYHVGFPQLWVYTLGLLATALALMIIQKRRRRDEFLNLAAAGLIAIALMSPLAVPQILATRGLIRPPVYGDGITWQWIAALLPYPLVIVTHPMGWGSTDVQYMGHLVYFGAIFAAIFLIAFVMVLLGGAAAWRSNAWLIAAGVALLLSMGWNGGLFTLLAHLPVLRTVNNDPFRALPIFVCFAVVGSAVFLERWMRASPSVAWAAVPLTILTLLLLAQHVWNARPSFYTYHFQPYPALPDSIAKRIVTTSDKMSGRMLSWSPFRSDAPEFAASLPLNLPDVYRVASFSGYDPLLLYGAAYSAACERIIANPLDALRAYGVRWHLISPLMNAPKYSPNAGQREQEQSVNFRGAYSTLRPQLTRIVNTMDVRLEELSEVSPLAFLSSDPTRSLPMTVGGNGMHVTLRSQRGPTRNLILNFLWSPRLRATADGHLLKSRPDEFGRISVMVPAKTHELRVRYVSGWWSGMLLGLIPLGAAIGIMMIMTLEKTISITPAVLHLSATAPIAFATRPAADPDSSLEPATVGFDRLSHPD